VGNCGIRFPVGAGKEDFMALLTDWPEPKAKVTLVVTPRLHKEGFFVGIGLTPAQPYEDFHVSMLGALTSKLFDEEIRERLYHVTGLDPIS